MNLLMASGNAHKIAEFKRMVPERFDVSSASEFDLEFPPETGETFEENAIAKASFACQKTNLISIADDSGLIVPALANAPGVRSARYAGPGSTDEDNVAKLLDEMLQLSGRARDASFICVVALAAPGHQIETVTGRIDGQVAYSPRGENGFGYDPIFMLDDGRTFAELSSTEKDRTSHRGKALAQIAERLESLR